jgi:hypothetical protein
MVQRMPSPSKVPSEKRNRKLSLCVARILRLDPSVSCYWYRRHRTLWRQWWIWSSSLSHLQWNLTTIRGRVTAKIFIYQACSFNKILLCRFHPNFLSTTIRECSISKLLLMLLVANNIALFVCFLLTDFNLRITLH